LAARFLIDVNGGVGKLSGRPSINDGGYEATFLHPGALTVSTVSALKSTIQAKRGICFTWRVRSYHVYILASRSRTLYIGVTGDILRRILEHKQRRGSLFTSKYKIDRLVHYEETDYVHAALAREKELKSWRRARKIALIEAANPSWADLSAEWYDQPVS
jgi:putative endonuclease